MPRVFLSHSSRDRNIANEMKQWLMGQGFEAPFLDFDKESGIAPGTNWEQTLYRELSTSQALLLLLSHHWQASKWCFAEFTQARALGKPVIPVIVGPIAEDGGLVATDIQSLDLRVNRLENLERLRLRLAEIALTAQGGLPWDGRRPPYPGLAALDEEDAALYFGREPEIRQVVERLTAWRSLGRSSLLVVLGASGSGKSSLLRAGVLPRLKFSGHQWLVLPVVRPQRRPIDSLSLALSEALRHRLGWREISDQMRDALRRGTQHAWLNQMGNELREVEGAIDASILLSIDQGEELFQQSEAEDLQGFWHLITAALNDGMPYYALMTLRSDVLADLQSDGKLDIRIDQLLLPPMPAERLEEVIRGPAHVAGIQIESGLVRELLKDAGTGDTLPLLAFTLRELYDRSAPDHHLTVSAYKALGDVRQGLSPLENAVRSAADRALALLRPNSAQLDALCQAFIPALVQVNEVGEYSRKPARWEDLPPVAQPLLRALVEARVLNLQNTQGQQYLEVTHEALLRKWPLLQGWLDEARQFLLDIRNLQLARQEWANADISVDRDGLLLHGSKLNRARAWIKERSRDLSPELCAFINASIEREDKQQMLAKTRRQRLLLILSTLTGFALSTTGLALWELAKARQAERQNFQSLAAALKDTDPTQAAIYALAGIDSATLDANTMEYQDHRLIGILGNALGKISQIEHLPLRQSRSSALLRLNDGTIVVASSSGEIRQLRPGTKGWFTLKARHPNVRALVKSGKDEWLSVSSDGSLRRWRSHYPLSPVVNSAQKGVVSLAALEKGKAVTGALDGTLQWWQEGRPQASKSQTGLGAIWALQALGDGTVLVAGDSGLVQRWNASGAASKAVFSGQGSVRQLTLLSDGTWVSGGEDGTVRTWHRGKPNEPIGPRVFGSISSLVSLPGNGLAWSVDSGGLVLWRPKAKPQAISIPTDSPINALQSNGGSRLIALELDGSFSSWQWPRLPSWLRDSGQGSIHALLVKRDGTLVTGGWDSTMRFWRDGKQVSLPIRTNQGPLRILQQLQNGGLLVGGLDATLQSWIQGRPSGSKISTAQTGIRSLLVLQNGDILTGGYNGQIRRWRHQKMVGPVLMNGESPVTSMVELNDGSVVTGDAKGQVRRLHWPYWKGSVIRTGQMVIMSIVPLDDQSWLTAGRDGTFRFWREGKPYGRTLFVEEGMSSWRVERLLDGELVVSSGKHSILRLLVPPRVAVREACQRLKDLRPLQYPDTRAERSAAKICIMAGVQTGRQ